MKKAIVILLVLVLLASMFIFVACDGKTEAKTKIIIKVPALGMDISNIQSDVTSVADFLENVATAYMAKHSNVDIEIAEYEAAKEETFVENTLGTDAAPDILFDSFYNMKSYVYSGSVVSLDALAQSIGNQQIQGMSLAFNQDALDAGKIEGKSYMLPFYSQQFIFAYNYTMLKRAFEYANKSITVDSTTKSAINTFLTTRLPSDVTLASTTIMDFTNDEWDLILKILADFGSSYNYPMMMYASNTQGDSHIYNMLMNHGAVISKDGQITMNNANGIAALSRFANSNAAKYYPDKSENFDINDCIDLFLNSQLGFCICNNSLYNQYKSTIDFGLAYFRGGVSENYYYGFEVFDNGNKEKLNIAKDFVKFVYTGTEDEKGFKENVRYSCCAIPAITAVEEKYKSNYITFYNGFKSATENCINGNIDTFDEIAEGIPNWNEVRRIFHKEMQELLKGSMTPEEVAAEIDTKCGEVIYNFRPSPLHA